MNRENIEAAGEGLRACLLRLIALEADTKTPPADLARKLGEVRDEAHVHARRCAAAIEAQREADHAATARTLAAVEAKRADLLAAADRADADARAQVASLYGAQVAESIRGRCLAAADLDQRGHSLDSEVDSLRGDLRSLEAPPAAPGPGLYQLAKLSDYTPAQVAQAAACLVAEAVRT